MVLAWFGARAVLEKTHGNPTAPLDDAYIHLQFARSFAEGTPLVYSPGGPAVAGATSFLWPLLLGVGYALGLRGQALIWEAWALGFIALGLLAAEARRAALGLTGPLTAAGAAALVFAFGANTWFAASGMEVVPLAWLMLRSVRRAAEWHELPPSLRLQSRLVELCVLAWAAPLMRPEGALVSVLIALVAGLTQRGRARARALIPLLGATAPALLNRALAGDFASTTARSKWLLLNPYSTPSSLANALADYLHTLVTTLLNGEVWSAVFLPRGSAPFALAALLALPVLAYRRGLWVRGALLTALALGICFPGSYDCPLCNRLRYLWPFFPAWFVGAACLAELVSEPLARRARELAAVGPALLGALAGGLASYLPFALDDLGTSAAAIGEQQVKLGTWARDSLPAKARIGLNDAGAITYFSERRTFDIVGLITPDEARYWTAGPGSRFEHYERLGVSRLPTHFIVYPEWFALDDLLGTPLFERAVYGATILGGERMVAYEADYSGLGSAELPDPALLDGRTLVDRLDVADLESESAHAYELAQATQRENYLARSGGRLDAGRAGRKRDRFQLALEPGGRLVLRVAADDETTLSLSAGAFRADVALLPSTFHEAVLDLPAELTKGKHSIEIESRGKAFASLHYFSLSAR